jgi:hypothetical protein
MIKYCKILIFLLLLTFLTTVPGKAQSKIQVVTKTVSKTFENCNDCNLNVLAEKADIILSPSKDNVIRIKLSLIAKNPDKEKAEIDLKYCIYNIKELEKSIMISNTFNIGNNKYHEISSNLSVKYEIDIPSGIVLKLKNIYGDITLNDINANQNITLDFGQLSISDLSGTIYITSNYGDIKGSNINANCTIQARNSDISLSNFTNTLKIKNQYGSIKLEKPEASINVEGEMTEINILLDDIKKYNFDISGTKCDLIVPDELKKFAGKKSGSSYLTTLSGNTPLKIRNTYSSININKR